MNNHPMSAQFLTGDVGDEQQHVGYNPDADDALNKEIRVYDSTPETPKSSEPRICYSHNNELFNDDISFVLDEFTDTKEIGEEVTYWQGETSPYTHASFLDIEQLVDNMRECAWDEAYEDLAEAYLDDMTDKHKRELSALILNYLNTHLDQPTFYGVKNIEEITGWWDGEDVTQTPMMTADEVSNLVD